MANLVAATIKGMLPARTWRKIRRATNRLRWVLKFRLLGKYNFPITRHPLRAAAYVLWDPEVESYSYHLANEPQLAQFLANLLKVNPADITRWIEEAKADPVLARDRGFHWSSKRFQPLGNRLMWYPIVRARRPKLIVEAGVHEGLGSEVLLRALEKNAQEGSPGHLVSFDIHDDTGWLVAPHLKKNWTFVLESTLTGIRPAVAGREVDMFIHETYHEDSVINTELEAVLDHAAEEVVVVDSSGLLCRALPEACERYGTEHHYFLDQSKDHIVASYGSGFAVFQRDKVRQAKQVTTAAADPLTEQLTEAPAALPQVHAAAVHAGRAWAVVATLHGAIANHSAEASTVLAIG